MINCACILFFLHQIKPKTSLLLIKLIAQRGMISNMFIPPMFLLFSETWCIDGPTSSFSSLILVCVRNESFQYI
ncbi:hypothetical protein CW304_24925 [Bacillus sp. UFRGS-B20]|nr:hypothetical protein CW304_24925 [Bacillus sp. UFRGS-B20]